MMNPNSTTGTKPLTSDQQSRLNSVMSAASSSQASPKPTDNPLYPPAVTQAPISTNSLSSSSTQNPTTVMPPLSELSPPPQSTYAAPTISPPLATVNMTTSTAHNKPAKAKGVGGTSLKIIGFVVGGMVLLVVYTLVWTLIFNLTLPFGISMPF